MSSDNNRIIESLEIVADRAGDITERVFSRYHQLCPDSARLMDHMDGYMLGRMMDQVLLLLMEEGEAELSSYLEFETKSHESYGVEPYMYENLFDAILGTVSEAAGPAWNEEFQSAWEDRISILLSRISSAHELLHKLAG